MRPNIGGRRQLFLVLTAILAFCTLAHSNEKTTQTAAFPRLNKMLLAEGDEYGPLSGKTKFAPASEIVLLWGQPLPTAQPGNSEPDRVTMQIFSCVKNAPSLPINDRLLEQGQLGLEGEFIGVDVNENMEVATGDLDGDGRDDVVSIWNTPNNRAFLMFQHVSKDALEFEYTNPVGHGFMELPTQMNTYIGQTHIATGDFTDNGLDEVAAAFHDATTNTVYIIVYRYDENTASRLKYVTEIKDEPLGNTEAALFDIVEADLNQDGDDELVLVGVESSGAIYVKVYDFVEAGTISSALRGTPNFSVQGGVVALGLASGDFDGDGVEEVAVGVSASESGINFASVHFAQADAGLTSLTGGDSTGVEMQLNQDQDDFRGSSTAAGDINGDGRDDVVLAVGDEIMVFEAEASGNSIKPAMRTNAVVTGSADSQDYFHSRDYVDVADLDSDRKQEIVVVRNEYNPGDQESTQRFNLYVFGATSGFNLDLKARETGYRNETVSDNADFRRHYAIALGDFNGVGILAGKPRRFSKTEIVQPLVILNAPPVHFDIINGTPYDLNSCFDFNSCPKFAATYDQQQNDQNIMRTEVGSSWGLSTTVSGEASYAGVTAKASVTASVGQDFSKVQGASTQTTVTLNVDAVEDDQIYAIVTDYDIWEYPLMEDGETKGHILVTVPRVTEARWFNSNSWSAFSYVPDHEVGNILSYREYADLNHNGYILEKVKGNLAVDDINSFTLSATSDYLWSFRFEDFQTNQASQSQRYGLEVGASVSYGRNFGLFGASVSVEVNGSYSQNTLTSHTSNVTNALNLMIHLGAIDRTIGEVEYIVTPYAYWGQNGALIIDYAARPELSQAGGTETWWQQEYGDFSDPALILPFRFFPEKGRPLQDNGKRFQTKDIVFDPADPQPGEEILITARLHNYSLIPTGGPVSVRFYVGDPDNGGELVTGTAGETEVMTAAFIPARDTASVQLRWQTPTSLDKKFIFDGEFARIYAEIDPSDAMQEIHETNNLGWNILQLTGIVLTGVEADAGVAIPDRYALYDAFPNPFNPETRIRYDLMSASDVELTVFNTLGVAVRTLVNRRQTKGEHNVVFNASGLPSGIYYYRLDVNGAFVDAKKITLLK